MNGRATLSASYLGERAHVPTTFSFARRSEESLLAVLSRSQPKKVLFVDDESMLVTLGGAMLDALGYEPAAFASAEEAIAAFKENPGAYTAAFTDLTMPVMSGFEVARELLTIRSNLPVFVMSGNVERDDELKALTLGVREVVLKPISMEQLRTMLERVG